MASIPYPNAFQQAQQGAHSPKGTVSEPDADLIGQFYPAAKREIVKGDYLRKKWEPLCGPRFFALIKALRAYCSYKVKEGVEMCYPSEETLAKACGVTRRTMINWLDRVKEGEEHLYPDLKVGDFCHKRHGRALQKFLRIEDQRRYSPKDRSSVKDKHHYFIRMDDPPVPEDIPRIWARARELAIAHLEHQAQEQEREARRQDFEARAARAASSGSGDFTYNNVKNFHPQQCEKIAQDHLSLSPLTNFDFHRSTQERGCAAQAIRNDKSATNQQANRTKGNEEDAPREASASKSNGATAPHSEDQSRRAASLDDEDQEEEEARFQAAWEAAGGVISALLEEYGDAPAVARRDAFKVLRAYLALGAPIERIGPLAYLARKRVKAFEMRGGRILKTRAGFYVSTACNLAHEARKKGWNVERIRKADQAKPARKQEQHQGTRQPARQGERRSTRPTPAEAEALVMELGQQPETYAEAQAQVCQREEQRQAREVHEQAVRQQAQLYAQLDQAEQALKEYPEGGLAWERARREKQELERQIAALRQPETPTTLATVSTGDQQPTGQTNSDRAYQDSAHASDALHLIELYHLQHGQSCPECGCELYRELSGMHYGEVTAQWVCCRCLPSRGYSAYAEGIDLLYPRKRGGSFGK